MASIQPRTIPPEFGKIWQTALATCQPVRGHILKRQVEDEKLSLAAVEGIAYLAQEERLEALLEAHSARLVPVLTAAMDATLAVYLGHVLNYTSDMIRKPMSSEWIMVRKCCGSRKMLKT